MLRFFRNIRQKLIEQENIRKYIWYAVGEILLVMIGILLALQVNNWNEERKEQALSLEFENRIVEDLNRLIEISKYRSNQSQQILDSVVETQLLMERGTGLNSTESETVEYALLWFPRTQYQLPDLLTYEEMKDSGLLGLIRDVEMRKELAQLHGLLQQVENIYDKLSTDIERQFEVYNRYIRPHTDPETLNISYTYDFEAMSSDQEFVNTFARMTVHWRAFVFFMRAVNEDGTELFLKMEGSDA